MTDPTPPRRVARVVVDRARCFSHEQCVATAPQVFALDAEQISTVGDIRLADDDTLLAAARACPVQAIFVFDADGRQVYPEPRITW
jgi:ferredoxin